MNAPTPLRVAAATALAACLAAAGCATTSPGYGSSYGTSPPPVSGRCYDCGTVTRIESYGTASNVPNSTGAILGGIVGAVAGREIAKNSTDSKGRQNTATAAGAVAGAVAGNAIQNRAQANNGGYTVYVRMDNGSSQTVTQNDLGGIREGSYVRVYDGRAWAR